ncbi:MAG: 2-C-methyl-D-erythritol 4-phosphate cytidylyltransferase [Lachnospiraceae bacterium]|nr:2-C-methyl-D-erythritol 4-phosphate cytidylyltransferase [Lachnospiraceae bacterium]
MRKKIVAIVLAAGEGKRMGSGIPKQYMIIKSRPMVYYSLKTFQESEVDEIILVTGIDEIEYCQKYIVDKYKFSKVKKIVPGGCERYESVYMGLQAIEDADYVLIHDGARPMINQKIVFDSIRGAMKYGACVVGVPAKDTIKVVDEEEYAKETPPRKILWIVQTPQSFQFELVKNAYKKLIESGDTTATDDAMAVEQYSGHKVKLIMGSYDNIKVTTPEDVRISRAFFRTRKLFRVLHEIHDRIIWFQMKLYLLKKK